LNSGIMPFPCLAPGITTSSSSRPAALSFVANL
jgi:hypothetical protein